MSQTSSGGSGGGGMQPSSPVPPSVLSALASWPSLQLLPLADCLAQRAAVVNKLHEQSREVTAHLQWMQQQRQQQSAVATPQQRANEAAGILTPTQQADAALYARLHAFLMQMQHKQQQIEYAFQQQQQQLMQQQQQQHQQQQQRPDDAQPGGEADAAMADGHPSSHQQQSQQQHSQQPQQSQHHAGNNGAGAPQQQQQQLHPKQPPPHAASVPVIIPSSSSPSAAAAAPSSGSSSLQLPPGANSGVVVGGGAATPSPSAQPAFDWLLPEGRRKLPGPRYTKERTIRKTLFGKVVLFWDHQSQQRVAIKLSNKNLLREGRTTSGNIVSESPLDELKFLRMLSRKNEADGAAAAQPQHVHPGQNHVLQLLDECEDANDLWTVLEFCGKGEFFDIVCAANRFDEARARLYFIQLAQGVAYMHAHLICHLDLSLENLLMTDDDVLKICDFGLARMMELDERRHLVAYKGVAKNKPGKMGYMAPELFAGHSFYGHLCDIWGMGIILFICLTGVPPYQLPALSDQRFALIYNGNLNTLLTAWQMQNIMSPAAKDIIARMLCPPERRANIQQILAHPFVTGAPFPPQQQQPKQPQQQ